MLMGWADTWGARTHADIHRLTHLGTKFDHQLSEIREVEDNKIYELGGYVLPQLGSPLSEILRVVGLQLLHGSNNEIHEDIFQCWTALFVLQVTRGRYHMASDGITTASCQSGGGTTRVQPVVRQYCWLLAAQ